MQKTHKLIRDLASKDHFVRLAAARTLGNEKIIEAVEPLKILVYDFNIAVQAVAIEALGKIGNTASVTTLIECLKSDSPNIRKQSAEALGKIGNYKALPSLIKMSQFDVDHSVREVAGRAVYSLNMIVRDILDKLDEELSSDRGSDRLQAVKFLGVIGNDRAIELLFKALDNKYLEVQGAASEELKKLASVNVKPFLKSLDHEKPARKILAAEHLGQSGNTIAIDPLIDKLKDSNVKVVKASCKSLGIIGDEKAIEPLVKLLGQCDSETGEIIIDSISKIGGEAGLNTLIGMLQKEKQYQAIVEEKLFDLGGQALIPLALLLEKSGDNQRKAIIRVFNRHGVKVVDCFVNELKTPDIKLRKAAVLTLGLIGASRALEPLEDFQSSEDDEDLKIAADRAIKEIRKKKAKLNPTGIFSKFFSSVRTKVKDLFCYNEDQKVKFLKQTRELSIDKGSPVCAKCGNIISAYKTAVLNQGRNLGYCPFCNKVYCRDCSDVVLVGSQSTIKCPKCNVELDRV